MSMNNPKRRRFGDVLGHDDVFADRADYAVQQVVAVYLVIPRVRFVELEAPFAAVAARFFHLPVQIRGAHVQIGRAHV